MSRDTLIRVFVAALLLSFITVVVGYLFYPVSVVAMLGMVAEIDTFLISFSILYIASLLSQQKPKEAKVEERRLLKKLMLFCLFVPLTSLLIASNSVSGSKLILNAIPILRNGVVALIPFVSLSLSLVIIFPLILNILRRKYIVAGNKSKEAITTKIISVFIAVLIILAFMAMRTIKS